VKTLLVTLDLVAQDQLLKYLRSPHGVAFLESLLDARVQQMETEAAIEVTDPSVAESKILDILKPIRHEKTQIEYVRDFLNTLYAACLQTPAMRPGSTL
jgi:hypothetical protein